MGGSPSKLPPIIQRDPLPTAGAFVGGVQIGGTTQGCKYCSSPDSCGPCRFTVAQGVSASSAQLYREYGTISVKECTKFAEDSEKVRNREMSIDEFKTNLANGVYYERQDNGFCGQLVANSADLTDATTIDAIPWTKVRRPKIRKLTAGGGYSSITKLYIKPSIPFRVSFNGQSVDVSIMTLFHPSPIRIENVQHDAVLTLGDAGDPSTPLVVLIPLSGTVSPGPESQFIGRVASYIPGLLRPNPASGLYETINAPTGKDWNLSTLFPGTPNGGDTVVSKGYFAWGSTPPLEEYEKGRITAPGWFPDTIQYGWRPASNQSTQFIMLKDPFPISTYDLQSIRMLPVTPAEEAIPPLIPSSVVYNTATQCSAAAPTGTVRESYTNEEGECDAFAAIPAKPYDQGYAIAAYSALFVAVGILLALYTVLWMLNNPKISGVFKGWGSAIGDFFGKIAAGKGGPPPPVDELGMMGERAEERTSTVLGKENPLTKARERAAAERRKADERARIEKEAKEAADKKAADAKAAADKKAAAEAKAKADAEATAKAAADKKAAAEAEAKATADKKAAEAKAIADKKAAERARIEAEAKAKADAEEEDRLVAEQERRSAERRAKEAAIPPLEKANKEVGGLNVSLGDLKRDLEEQTGELQKYKDRYNVAVKDKNSLAETAAKDGIRKTRKTILDLRAEIAKTEEKLKTAEANVKALKEADETRIQESLKQNPPPVAPITKRTPEEDKKHAKMLERGKAFRGTSAASAAASAPAPAPAPSAPTKTLKRREIVSSDREVAPPPLPEQTKVIANQLREIGTLNDKVKNLDRKVNPIMARLRELGRKPEKNATDIAKLNQQGQSIAADATELRTQARQAISTLKAARKKEPKSADPAVQRLFGTADDGIKAAETVASQADAVAKVATATPTNLGTLLDQYKSKQYVQKPLTELELAKKQLVRSELEIKEKGWKKSGGKKKRKQTRKNRYR